MKKVFYLFFIGIFLFSVSLKAQDEDIIESDYEYEYEEEEEEEVSYKQFMVTGLVNFNIPIGDFGEFWGSSFGFTASLEYRITKEIGINLITGYFAFDPINDLYDSYNFDIIPINLGAYYYFSKLGNMQAYAGIELGINYTNYNIDFRDAGTQDLRYEAGNFGFSPVLGILIPFGTGMYMNFNAKYTTISTNEINSSYISIMGGLSYPF